MAKILLVDDEKPLREVLGAILSRENHAVITAPNGKEALRFLDAQTFDLTITDLIMPEKEGIETIMEIRRSHPGTKIIAMTGGGQWNARDYLSAARKLGASRTLAKPFSRRDFLDTVDDVLSSARGDTLPPHQTPSGSPC